MNCPKCGAKTGVEDTIGHHQRVMRRRICKKCGYTFTTLEIPQILATNTQELRPKP
jgi:transcriptional regulator NrdR family protein